jgi:hypothetical protein
MSNRSQRKRERQEKKYYEQRKAQERQQRVAARLPPRLGITAEIIEDLERRSLANIIAELESKQ